MKRIYFYIILVLHLIPITSIHAQITELSVSAGKDTILIGEHTDLQIRMVKEKNVMVKFPSFTDTLVNGIEIVSKSGIDTTQSGRDIILVQTLSITGFDSGYYFIPPLQFPIEFSDIRDTVQSVALSLRIDLPAIDPANNFRDIKPALNTPVNLKEALPYILIGLALLLLLLLAVFLIKKYKGKHREPELKTPGTPPYIIALEELQRLRIEKAWEKYELKEYYTRLSGIVRTYLEDQFNIMALESTTYEILRDFEKSYGKDPVIATKLEDLLQLSDLVKFAKEAPSSELNINNLDKAIEFVELTKPGVSEEPAQQENSNVQEND